jgi:hypothetical protein
MDLGRLNRTLRGHEVLRPCALDGSVCAWDVSRGGKGKVYGVQYRVRYGVQSYREYGVLCTVKLRPMECFLFSTVTGIREAGDLLWHSDVSTF